MFPHDRGLHPGQCRNVRFVVWMLQSGVIVFLRGTLNVAPYGHGEYYFAQSNGFML